MGRHFKQQLHRAATRGVAVYVIFDSFANLVVPRRFKRFAPPIHVLEYPLLPWPWHPLHLRSYARAHRKILVVDGAVAFVGGYHMRRRRRAHAGPDAGGLAAPFPVREAGRGAVAAAPPPVVNAGPHAPDASIS